jgi:hypothetical protein
MAGFQVLGSNSLNPNYRQNSMKKPNKVAKAKLIVLFFTKIKYLKFLLIEE